MYATILIYSQIRYTGKGMWHRYDINSGTDKSGASYFGEIGVKSGTLINVTLSGRTCFSMKFIQVDETSADTKNGHNLIWVQLTLATIPLKTLATDYSPHELRLVGNQIVCSKACSGLQQGIHQSPHHWQFGSGIHRSKCMASIDDKIPHMQSAEVHVGLDRKSLIPYLAQGFETSRDLAVRWPSA